MTDSHEDLLGYYYFGFHSALVRYRVLTTGGWVVTALGAAGLFVFWRDGSDLFTLWTSTSAFRSPGRLPGHVRRKSREASRNAPGSWRRSTEVDGRKPMPRSVRWVK